MSDGRRTLKLKTQRECSICGGLRYDVSVRPRVEILMCPRCDGRP